MLTSREIVEDITKRLAELNRNLVSDEFEESLDYLRRFIDLKIHRYKTGSECWTWVIPPKWRVREGYIKRGDREIVSFRNHPLHVMSYSTPVHKKIKGRELLEHVFVHHTLKEAIPYEFSFYHRRWGFCLTQAQKKDILEEETYEVLIDSEFLDDDLCVGEYTVPGTSDEHIFFLSHIDHPFQVNDGLIGAAVNVALAKRLEGQKNYYNYTFLFGPESIGSIAYLSHHEDLIPKIRYAAFVEMVGLDHPLILQKSREEQALINSYALYAMEKRQGVGKAYGFQTVAGNDEKIFDGPGIGIPSISLTRVNQEGRVKTTAPDLKEGTPALLPPYVEYHSHLDNLGSVHFARAAQSVECLYDLVQVIEGDFIPVRKFKGPVFLSKYDLWVDWRTHPELSKKIWWLMYCLEGKRTAFQIAQELNIDVEEIYNLLNKFYDKGLIAKERIPLAFDR
ncbi:MAG: hypothetical protein A2Z81_09735 [Omnitrophica WOR_2 bacterium GWA2_45_18]|nr:MAG: hypothetical protein A2Z81_09735 [Omnitrophica WOR_2 bacterium GWA2_45_18]